MSIRGIFDGGGVRKQNGHWQSSLIGKRALGVFHYNDPNDYFYGPVPFMKFKYANAISLNIDYSFELVRTGQGDWSDYTAGVGISRIITNVEHLTHSKTVPKENGYYVVTRVGSDGARYRINEYDENDVIQNRYQFDLSLLEIRSADMDYGEYIRNMVSTNTQAKTYNIDYSALYNRNGVSCVKITHTTYVNGSSTGSTDVYEPVTFSSGTLVLTPSPYMYSSTQRWVNGGGGKMITDNWPINFSVNVNLQVPTFDTSGATLFNQLMDILDLNMSTDIELRWYYVDTLVSSGHFVVKVY